MTMDVFYPNKPRVLNDYYFAEPIIKRKLDHNKINACLLLYGAYGT